MKLKDFSEKYPDKARKLRTRVNCHPKRWPVYVNGDAIPRKKLMGQIARGTDYLVTANDFYGIDPARAAAAANGATAG